MDKATGYLRVDRPQRSSSQPPTLYGFIPRIYCGARVGKLFPGVRKGDGDPLDICVLSRGGRFVGLFGRVWRLG